MLQAKYRGVLQQLGKDIRGLLPEDALHVCAVQVEWTATLYQTQGGA